MLEEKYEEMCDLQGQDNREFPENIQIYLKVIARTVMNRYSCIN